MAITPKTGSDTGILISEAGYPQVRKHNFFWKIFVVGLLLRLIWILFVKTGLVGDFAYYYDVASSYASTRDLNIYGLPTAFQGLGYPILLGTFLNFVGANHIFFAKIFNFAASLVTLGVSFQIFKKLVPEDIRVANVASVILAVFPPYIAYNSITAPEVIFTMLFSITILLQITDFENNVKRERGDMKQILFLYYGILVGLMVLVKPYFIIYPLVLGLVDWFKDKDTRKTLKKTGLITVTMLLVISPMVYRNCIVFDRVMFLTNSTGYVLYVNNNSQNNWAGWMYAQDVKRSTAFDETLAKNGFKGEKELGELDRIAMKDPSFDPLLRNEALKWIALHPVQFTQLGFLRVYNTLFAGSTDVRDWSMVGAFQNPSYKLRRIINIFVNISSIMFFVLNVCGVLFTIRYIPIILRAIRNKSSKIDFRITIPVLNILLFAMISFIFEGQPRFSFPLFVLTAFCAGYIIVLAFETNTKSTSLKQA
jgi:hypothetical protein